MEIIETTLPREEAGKTLSETLKKYANTPILLMLSGGSAFTILDFVSLDALGPNVTMTVLDERYSADPHINNFAQLEQTNFYKTSIERGVEVISTRVLKDERMEDVRNRFDVALHEWKEKNKDGVMIATMGVGPDGHVAGIFPGRYGIDFNGDKWVVGYSVPKEVNEYVDRITVTNTFLTHILDEVIIYIDRDTKPEIVSKLIAQTVPRDVPMGVLYTLKRSKLFTGVSR